MKYEIRFLPSASRELEALPDLVKRRLNKHILALAVV